MVSTKFLFIAHPHVSCCSGDALEPVLSQTTQGFPPVVAAWLWSVRADSWNEDEPVIEAFVGHWLRLHPCIRVSLHHIQRLSLLSVYIKLCKGGDCIWTLSHCQSLLIYLDDVIFTVCWTTKRRQCTTFSNTWSTWIMWFLHMEWG